MTNNIVLDTLIHIDVNWILDHIQYWSEEKTWQLDLVHHFVTNAIATNCPLKDTVGTILNECGISLDERTWLLIKPAWGNIFMANYVKGVTLDRRHWNNNTAWAPAGWGRDIRIFRWDDL